MKIHEYQAKAILKDFGVSTLQSKLCHTQEEAEEAAQKLGFPCVVKAQIHAGSRGKGGGIKLAKNKEEAKLFASKMLKTQLVTPQTDAKGQPVNSILIEEGCQIEKELYVGALIDRDHERVCLMASVEGGVDIEEVAAKTPEKILKQWVDPIVGLMPFQARKLAYDLGLTGELHKKMVKALQSIYQAFVKTDASLIEINPLVLTKDNNVVALDAKFNFDESALFRHKDVIKLNDPTQEDDRETQAKNFELSYIALEGNIGCMVNGAGLAMATMDIIKHVGGEPANFLDVGGGATQEKVTEALKLILKDKLVRAVFINVFGGIAKCDVIAAGIVNAVKELKDISQPLVVRLEGTNVEKGKSILKESGLSIIAAEDLLDGAKKAVEATNR